MECEIECLWYTQFVYWTDWRISGFSNSDLSCFEQGNARHWHQKTPLAPISIASRTQTKAKVCNWQVPLSWPVVLVLCHMSEPNEPCTLFIWIDITATINCGSAKLWHLIKGSYYSRAASINTCEYVWALEITVIY